MDLQQQLQQLLEQATQAINVASDLAELENLRVTYLGKKGQLTIMLKQLGKCSSEERPKIGQMVNEVKQQLLGLFARKQESLQQAMLDARIQLETIDVTLPGRELYTQGALHPLSLVFERAANLFSALGFQLVEGPEMEDEYHNFEALNIDENHPARQMHDTFYFGDGELLRTQTSPVQIRTMKQNKPPFRIVSLGRVYRRDSDHTHTPMFHQVEGLVVNQQCSFAELKGLLQDFLNRFFEKELKLRFRPSYFPFTEPSAEVDIQCTHCDGAGCRTCGHNGWLEVLGCGMVHPNVLKQVNVSTEEYAGYAFGIGLDRLAMLAYGIPDLRLLFENDYRFLKQFVAAGSDT